MENIEIIEPHAHDRAAVDDINRLLEQLTPSPERFTAERLAAISADGASRLWLLRVDGRVAGMGTHDELLAACPVYQEIYASQTGGDAK